ncbi:MAG: class I SAM-dependent methyltransferase, partial [Gemmatimonadaceae bacterium]
MDGEAWIDRLLSSEGQRLLADLATEDLGPATEISLITRLRRTYAPDLVANALEQTKLRARAARKFARAERMLFTAAGLEQASSERMAAHHAERYAAFPAVADLCCGIGGDAIGLAARSAVMAVDRDPVHVRLAEYNAGVADVARSVNAVLADVRDLAFDGVEAVFIDPARRSGDRRLKSGASEPALDWCFDLANRVSAVGIKAAPGLPTELAPDGWELEFVSEGRELKEAALWSPALRSARRRATILPEGQTTTERPGAFVDVRDPGRFLIDPDPSITRAGLVEELGESLGESWKIDERVAFLSSDRRVATPFGRTLRIEASMPWSLAKLRDSLRALDVGPVDIRKRGSAVDVD